MVWFWREIQRVWQTVRGVTLKTTQGRFFSELLTISSPWRQVFCLFACFEQGFSIVHFNQVSCSPFYLLWIEYLSFGLSLEEWSTTYKLTIADYGRWKVLQSLLFTYSLWKERFPMVWLACTAHHFKLQILAQTKWSEKSYFHGRRTLELRN